MPAALCVFELASPQSALPVEAEISKKNNRDNGDETNNTPVVIVN